MNVELAYQMWPEEMNYSPEQIETYRAALAPYKESLLRLKSTMLKDDENIGISREDLILPQFTMGMTTRDGWKLQVRYFEDTNSVELHILVEEHRSFIDGEDIVYEHYTNHPEEGKHTSHFKTWDAGEVPVDLDAYMRLAWLKATSINRYTSLPLVWSSRRNAQDEKERLARLEETRRVIEEIKDRRTQEIELVEDKPMPNIFSNEKPWEESITGEWSPDSGIYNLRDLPISELTELLLSHPYAIETALIEMHGHGDHKRSVELARSLAKSNPNIELRLRKNLGKAAYYFLDKPIEEFEAKEEPKPKPLN